MKTQQDLYKEIDESITALEELSKNDSYPWAVRSGYNLAKVNSNTAKIAEVSTRRVVVVSWVLAVLTVFLIVLAAVQIKIMLK